MGQWFGDIDIQDAHEDGFNEGYKEGYRDACEEIQRAITRAKDTYAKDDDHESHNRCTHVDLFDNVTESK